MGILEASRTSSCRHCRTTEVLDQLSSRSVAALLVVAHYPSEPVPVLTLEGSFLIIQEEILPPACRHISVTRISFCYARPKTQIICCYLGVERDSKFTGRQKHASGLTPRNCLVSIFPSEIHVHWKKNGRFRWRENSSVAFQWFRRRKNVWILDAEYFWSFESESPSICHFWCPRWCEQTKRFFRDVSLSYWKYEEFFKNPNDCSVPRIIVHQIMFKRIKRRC